MVSGKGRSGLSAGAVLLITVAFGAFSSSSQAAGPMFGEPTYVPGGQAYGPGTTTLPPLNSERSKLQAQVDIYEMEIRANDRRQRRFQEMFRNFQNLDNFAPRNSYRY